MWCRKPAVSRTQYFAQQDRRLAPRVCLGWPDSECGDIRLFAHLRAALSIWAGSCDGVKKEHSGGPASASCALTHGLRSTQPGNASLGNGAQTPTGALCEARTLLRRQL